jgi:hypothetical protein
MGQGVIKSRTSTQIVVTENMTGTGAGNYTVKVKNSDGQLSNGVTLTITAASPVISYISPSSAAASSFDLTIYGSNFDSGAVDQIYTPTGAFMGQGVIKSRTGTQIVVTENMTGTGTGNYTVKVKNSTGQLSNGVTLTIH